MKVASSLNIQQKIEDHSTNESDLATFNPEEKQKMLNASPVSNTSSGLQTPENNASPPNFEKGQSKPVSPAETTNT